MVVKCNVPDNWPVEPGVYYLGNKFHPVAVLVPNDDDVGREIIRHVVDMGVAIAGFCKTANIGIEKVICNVLANPNIRYIVVAGNESPGHKSGKALINLWRHGVDKKTRRILCGEDTPCTDIPTGYIPNLPLEAIEIFRRQVTVIDLLIDNVEVTRENVVELVCRVVMACVQEPEKKQTITIKGITYTLFDPGAFSKTPFRYTITQKVEKTYIETLSENYTSIVVDTIARAYDLLVSLVKMYGREVSTRFGKCRELLNVCVHVLNPLDDTIPETYPLKSREYLREYCRQVVEGKSIPEFEYTYGERLRIEFGDQLNKVVDKLHADLSSRQCVVALWHPSDLDRESSPCITHVQIIVRDERLHLTAYLRSHDVEHAFVHNMFLLREIMLYLVEKLRERGVDVKPGTLTVHICSCHVYLV